MDEINDTNEEFAPANSGRLIQKPEDVIVLAAFGYVAYCTVRASIWVGKDIKTWRQNRKEKKNTTTEVAE